MKSTNANSTTSKTPRKKTPKKRAAKGGPPVLQLDPAKCRPHEALELLAMEQDVIAHMKEAGGGAEGPDRGDREAEWGAFQQSVATLGVLEPVKVVRDKAGDGWVVVDGRHRRQAALEAGRPLPAMEIPAEQVDAVIATSMLHRRHISKSLRAWLMVCLHPELAGTTKGGDRKSQMAKNQSYSVGLIGRGEAAERAGVSLALIDHACSIYSATEENPEMRREKALQIAAGKGLGALISGEGGGAATKGEPRKPSSWNSTVRTMKSLTTQVKEYGGWDPKQRGLARTGLAKHALQWPEEFREDLQAALDAAEGGQAE